MDPLTHSLLGAAMASTRWCRHTPLALPTLVLAANGPDVDVFSYVAGSDVALGFRRGWTHGPIGLAVLPLIQVLLLIGWHRWRSRSSPSRSEVSVGALVLLSYLGTLSHPVLDWLNTYGVRFLMPFSERWFYGDALFIVDPWMWLVLGGAVVLARTPTRRAIVGWCALAAVTTLLILAALPAELIAAKVVWCVALLLLAAIGWRRRTHSENGHRFAAAAIVLFLVYSVSMVALGRAAERIVVNELERSLVVESVMAGPEMATPFRRDVVVETPSEYRLVRFDWLAVPRVELLPDRFPRSLDPETSSAVASDPSIRGFLAWSRFLVAERGEDEVGLFDLRYARRPTAAFGGAVARLKGEHEGHRSRRRLRDSHVSPDP